MLRIAEKNKQRLLTKAVRLMNIVNHRSSILAHTYTHTHRRNEHAHFHANNSSVRLLLCASPKNLYN